MDASEIKVDRLYLVRRRLDDQRRRVKVLSAYPGESDLWLYEENGHLDFCSTAEFIKPAFSWQSCRSWRPRIGRRTLFLLVTAAAFLTLLSIPVAIPPWNNRFAFFVQRTIADWTGLYFHRFPDDFTGTMRGWDKDGNLAQEYAFEDGMRHGLWIDYDANGNKTSVSEYRNDEPWDGICYIVNNKAFQGEYRDGQPWNGRLPIPGGQQLYVDWKYYIDGQEASEVDYKTRYQIPEKAYCIGLNHMSE